jgi:hypothetical protein
MARTSAADLNIPVAGLFGRYHLESGLVVLTVSFVDYDPEQTLMALAGCDMARIPAD